MTITFSQSCYYSVDRTHTVQKYKKIVGQFQFHFTFKYWRYNTHNYIFLEIRHYDLFHPFRLQRCHWSLELGMAIPRRISFLEESRSRGMANLHSSGIEEDEIYSLGSSGNFEDWVIPKITKKSWKSPQNSNKFWKNLKKKISIGFVLQSWVIIPKIDR